MCERRPNRKVLRIENVWIIEEGKLNCKNEGKKIKPEKLGWEKKWVMEKENENYNANRK